MLRWVVRVYPFGAAMAQGADLVLGGQAREGKAEVCALYLPNTGHNPTDMLGGVTAAKRADIAAYLLKPCVRTLRCNPLIGQA